MAEFASRPGERFVIVGCAFKMTLNPHTCLTASIHAYRIHQNDRGRVHLEFLHKTPVDDVPGAVAPFQGRLLAGVGRILRIYDMGKKKLLRKCENKKIATFITNIETTGYRIVANDIQESFHFLKYKRNDNQLVLFADDTNPSFLTCGCILDYDTVAGADKFGNVFFKRLPTDVRDDVDEDPTGVKALWDRGVLNGASQKVTKSIIMWYQLFVSDSWYWNEQKNILLVYCIFLLILFTLLKQKSPFPLILEKL